MWELFDITIISCDMFMHCVHNFVLYCMFTFISDISVANILQILFKPWLFKVWHTRTCNMFVNTCKFRWYISSDCRFSSPPEQCSIWTKALNNHRVQRWAHGPCAALSAPVLSQWCMLLLLSLLCCKNTQKHINTHTYTQTHTHL